MTVICAAFDRILLYGNAKPLFSPKALSRPERGPAAGIEQE
ncbi:hypothetical protein OHAE_879 [Ochrobactrum soli]|uniref:Uncharacterized protein n=1 Tax=Ochrobactrum soli TaxID=2448455 RepID=A0A2P9HLN9_9HYPH|nr:hypothetical protein OHAE_879 [[Ochrobactrum] soli]